ncbi:uncharacterized protein SPEM3 [Nannospalax galili]|uniref:uncharacterized protein SPEM3 n=1 Tax=Nannospalax galili TaxID=1026970 RepID=UPI00111C3866|nr:uncharacterized protein SPEM3 [Nannospalax galili]
MGEQIYHGAQTCSGTNPRRCQDLGDSILLILGSFILLNVGINVVILLWRHLKNSLRILFHHFFPKDKQPIGLNSRPMCVRGTIDPRNLYSRISSHFNRSPSFILGHVNHLDSWIPDTNNENASRCCWMPPQCRHARAPTEAPWELWKEGIMGAGEAPQATAMKIQAPLFSKPEISPQFLKINKLDIVAPSLPQETKTKASDDNPVHTLAHTHEHLITKSQTYTSEHTSFQAQGLEHTSTHTPPNLISDSTPTHDKAPTLAPTLPPIPSHSQAPTPHYAPAQTLDHSQTHGLAQAKPYTPVPIQVQVLAPTPAQGSACSSENNHSQAHSPEQTSVHTLPQPPNQPPDYASSKSKATSIPAPVCTPTPAQELSMTMTATPAPAQVLTTAPIPILSPPIPSTLAAFGSSFPTGHVISDTHKVKKKVFLKTSAQSCRNYRKDLNNPSWTQEGQGLGNSGTSEQTSKQHSGDSAESSSGSILGYLELGNMEWKISDSVKDIFSQPKTFPYCSFHPCCSERKNTESQAPVYPKFLIYTQDTTPSKPCLHSPSSSQNTQSTSAAPCTLSLPLVSPRTFVLPQSNHQKPFNLLQTPTFLPTSKFPQTVSPSHFFIHSPFSTISQPLIQPQKSQDLTQDLDHQRTSSPAKDSRVSRNPSLTPAPGFHKNPGLTQNPGLHKNQGLTPNPGLHKNPCFPGLTQDSYCCTNPNPSQNSCLHKNPGITQDSALRSSVAIQDAGILSFTQPCPHKNMLSTQTPDQGSLGFIQDSGIYRNVKLNQDTIVYKDQDLSPTCDQKRPAPSQDPGGNNSTGNVQDPEACRSSGLTQDSRPQESQCHSQNTEVNKTSELPRGSGLHKSPGFFQASCCHKNSGLMKDSGDSKNLGLIQDSEIYRVPDLTQESNAKSPTLTHATEFQKRLNVTQNVGICRSSEHTQDPNLHKCPGINQDSGPHQSPELAQGSGFPKTPNLAQQVDFQKDSCLIPDPGIKKNPGLLTATGTAQVLGPLQKLKLASSPVKSSACKMATQKEEAVQHVPWTSVPNHQNAYLPNARVLSTDLQNFSEVPVLVELQPSCRRLGSKDWVCHPVDTVSPCQNYQQKSMPPKITRWSHCPGPGSTRTGHVISDSRQKTLVLGRDKCEALSPRRPH